MSRSGKVVMLGWLVAGLLAFLFWLERRDRPFPKDVDRRQSAIWLAHKWFGKAPPAQEIRAAGTQLASLGFRDLYFHVGPLDAQGHIPAWDRKAWEQTLGEFRAALPGLQAYAWVGGVTVTGYGQAPDTVDPAQSQVRAEIVETCQILLKEGGFQGIHYDLEPVKGGDAGFLTLLEQTRTAIAPHPLSVAGSCAYWDPPYLKSVSDRCDQVALMAYDLGCPTPEAYQDYLEKLVPVVCNQLQGGHCRAVLGVPTYGEPTPNHNPQVENMTNALIGIKRGLLRSPRHRAFQGVGIYAHWTTEPAAWEALERLWQP